MVLDNFGIHKMESFPKKGFLGRTKYFFNSFFIKRTYLNYTIFSPFEFEHLKDFIFMKGGLGKQLHTSTKQFNKSTETFFNLFGSSAVVLEAQKYPENREELFHKNLNFRLENWGDEFYDKDIIIDLKSEINQDWFTLFHHGKKFLITDESIIFTDEGWVPNPDFECLDNESRQPEKIFKSLSKLDLDFHIPRCHRGTYRMQKLNSSKLEKNINLYSKNI